VCLLGLGRLVAFLAMLLRCLILFVIVAVVVTIAVAALPVVRIVVLGALWLIVY